MPASPAHSVLQQLVVRARDLYSLPAVALKVIELTSAAKVDVRALKDCIENDPALTTKILRVVNSSLFGLTREVTDLNQALALLGIKPLKMLVLGFSLPKNLFAAIESDVLSRYWRHTLTKAVVGRELSQRALRAGGDEAFIAGLLQEIGQLVLIQDLGDPYIKFLHRVHHGGGALMALEMQSLGFDHAILSARLLAHWGLPEAISQAVAQPHEIERIQALPPAERGLPQVLHLSELIARLLVSEQRETLGELIAASEAYGLLSVAELPLLLDSLDDKVQQLAAVLRLQIEGSGDYRAILAEAHAQLAQVASEAALEMLDPANVWQETQTLAQAASDFAQRPARATPKPVPEFAPLPAKVASAPLADSPRRAGGATNGRWNDPGFVGRVIAAVGVCRQARQPLSVLLLEVDRFDEWILTRGAEGTTATMRVLRQTLARELEDADQLLHLGDGQFAAALAGYDRQQGAETARQCKRRAAILAAELNESGTPLTISVGLASVQVPAKNFPALELIAAAQRCLDVAQLSGGDTAKSIEIV